MQRGFRLIFVCCILLLHAEVTSQTVISIPAYTAYAVPADESKEDDESKMFTLQNGLHNWTNSKQQIQFFFKIRHKGKLHLSLQLKNTGAGNNLSVSVAGNDFTVIVPKSTIFIPVTIGTVQINDTGFYTVTVSAGIKKTNTIADIKSLELSGDATKNIHFNATARRNSASVHLIYPLPDSPKVISF